MRRAACLYTDPARRQRREEGKKVAAAKLPRHHHLACIVNRVDEEYMLGQVEADRGDRRKIDGYFTHGRCSCADRLDNDTRLAGGFYESTAKQSAVHTISLMRTAL